MNSQPKTQPSQSLAKKNYTKPQMVIYGNIVGITQASKLVGKDADGGTGVRRKTR